MREIEQHAAFAHPALVPLYAAFEDTDGIYLAMELLPGNNVTKLLHSSGGYLPEDKAKAVAAALCNALAYLHSKVQPGSGDVAACSKRFISLACQSWQPCLCSTPPSGMCTQLSTIGQTCCL